MDFSYLDFDHTGIQALVTGLTFFFTALITLFLFTTARKDRLAFSFAVTTFLISLWGLSGFFFHALVENNPEIAVKARIISASFIPLLTAGVITFALTFYERARGKINKVYTRIKIGAYVAAFILAGGGISDVFFDTKFVSRGLKPGTLYPEAGPFLGAIMVFFALGVLATIIYVFLAQHVTSNANIKRQAWWILSSIGIAFILGGLRFQLWYGVEFVPVEVALLGPFVFAIGIFYAISRHHLFNARIISAELLTFAIWAALFWIFLTSQNSQEYIINGSLLTVVLILGTFLIRSILSEVRQREQVEELNKKLENFNDVLESRVEERTRELKEANLHIEAIIENLTVGIIEYSEGGSIHRLNHAAETMLGVSREEIAEKKLEGGDLGKASNSLAAVMFPSQEGVYNDETDSDTYSVVITYPEYRELQVTTIFLRKYKDISGRYIKLIQDVTRQKRVDRSKSRFMSVAAHQLRTPASAVKWGLDELRGGQAEKLSDKQRELVSHLVEVNQNMIDIINNLLNASLLESEQLGYKFQEKDITGIVTEAVNKRRKYADHQSIDLLLETPEKEIDPIPVDEQNIQTVVDILLENAIDYTPEGGSVTVRVKDEDRSVGIEVSDTGIGISKEDQQLLFTKFFRSEQAIGIDRNRSGLGLFVARHIIDQHNGKVSVSSKKNAGTTISFTLPKKQPGAIPAGQKDN